MFYHILEGHALQELQSVVSNSVQTVITSPPYWGLRDYRTPPAFFPSAVDSCEDGDHDFEESATLQDNLRFRAGENTDVGNQTNEAIFSENIAVSQICRRCGGWMGQLGLEASPKEYVRHLVQIFEQVHRCLKDTGTLWVNIADTYAADRSKQVSQTVAGGEKSYEDERYNGIGCLVPEGMKPKDLIGIPWMLAFALRDAGWYLRSDIIWEKENPMPESVKDRPTKAHEYIFLLSKSRRYYYDYEAIQEEQKAASIKRMAYGWNGNNKRDYVAGVQNHMSEYFKKSPEEQSDMRNRRTVWRVATQPSSEEHYAMYPEKLIEPCVLAGSAEGDTVMDIFSGTGTTGIVAVRHLRNYIGIELNPASVLISKRRVEREATKLPLLEGL